MVAKIRTGANVMEARLARASISGAKPIAPQWVSELS